MSYSFKCCNRSTVKTVNYISPSCNGNVALTMSAIPNDAYYVVDPNYVHTDNNYTNEEKTKLADKEDVINKVSNWQTVPTNIAYPSEKLVKDNLDELQEDVDQNSASISALQGRGGALHYIDEDPTTITQESLTEYACEQIWGSGGTFTWNATTPANSTYVTAGGATHTASEIFNSTWVRNDRDHHKWVLTNTPNTNPPVFDWEDAGVDVVDFFNETTAGIIKGDTTFGKVKSHNDGTGSVNGLLGNGDGDEFLADDGNYQPVIKATTEITGIAPIQENEDAAIAYSNAHPTELVFYPE